MKKKKLLTVLACCVGLITACGSKERRKVPQGETVPHNNTTTSVENTSGEETTSEEPTSKGPETTTEQQIPFWYDEKYSYIIKPGESRTLHYDIDNDGKDEAITLYAQDALDINAFPQLMMKITDGESILFQTKDLFTGFSHEWMSYMYYIVRENGKNYLLEFDCIISLGEDVRSYRLLEFLEDGTVSEVEKVESDLTYSRVNNTTDVDDAVKYYEKAMGYLERKDTILLFDLDVMYGDMVCSSDGDIKYADSRIEENIFEHTISEINFRSLSIEWNENDTFREKVKKYCEDWMERQHQD